MRGPSHVKTREKMTVCKGILFSQIRVCKNSSGPLPAVIFFGKKQNNSADPHPLLMPDLAGGSLLFAEKNRQREGDTVERWLCKTREML